MHALCIPNKLYAPLLVQSASFFHHPRRQHSSAYWLNFTAVHRWAEHTCENTQRYTTHYTLCYTHKPHKIPFTNSPWKQKPAEEAEKRRKLFRCLMLIWWTLFLCILLIGVFVCARAGCRWFSGIQVIIWLNLYIAKCTYDSNRICGVVFLITAASLRR